jgi:hypothetical protein
MVSRPVTITWKAAEPATRWEMTAPKKLKNDPA